MTKAVPNILQELELAGIPCLKNIESPPTAWLNDTADAKLGEWEFSRKESLWEAKASCTKDRYSIPYSVLDSFEGRHSAREFKIMSATRVVDEIPYEFKIHIYTQAVLTAFAALIKAFTKE